MFLPSIMSQIVRALFKGRLPKGYNQQAHGKKKVSMGQRSGKNGDAGNHSQFVRCQEVGYAPYDCTHNYRFCFVTSNLRHSLWLSVMSQSTDSSEAIIQNFVEGIRDPFTFVSLITPLCACLVTLLVVLFVFSTRELRRRLIFRLNVIAICFALILGVLNFIVSSSAILRPFDPVPQSLYTTTIVVALFPPVFYDSILLTRLLALYPVDRTPLSVLVGILAFPICVKCGRLVVLVCLFPSPSISNLTLLQSLYIRQYVSQSRDLATLTAYAQATWYRNPFITIEWTLQMFDNLYGTLHLLSNIFA